MSELIHVKGLDELERNFHFIEAKVGTRILLGGVSAGARVIKAAVISNIRALPRLQPSHKPGHPGLLERAVIINYRRKDSNATQAVYIVTLRRGKKNQKKNRDAYYAPFVEFGHRKVPRLSRGHALTLRARREVESGDVPPHKFLTPAINNNVRTAIGAISASVARDFDQILA